MEMFQSLSNALNSLDSAAEKSIQEPKISATSLIRQRRQQDNQQHPSEGEVEKDNVGVADEIPENEVIPCSHQSHPYRKALFYLFGFCNIFSSIW